MQEITEAEQKQIAIEKYINLQRIKKYGSAEIDYQDRIARAELQILGISSEDFELEKEV